MGAQGSHSQAVLKCFPLTSFSVDLLVAMSSAPPKPEELEAAAGALKKVETKSGGDFDEAPYKAAWDHEGGDCAKIKAALNLTAEPKDYDDFITMCKQGSLSEL